jgi:hypothetical protein
VQPYAAAHQAGEISEAAMRTALPKCFPLAETHKDSTDIVVAALKFATLQVGLARHFLPHTN